MKRKKRSFHRVILQYLREEGKEGRLQGRLGKGRRGPDRTDEGLREDGSDLMGAGRWLWMAMSTEELKIKDQ